MSKERFDKTLIPKGMYCYGGVGQKEDGAIEINICPYWARTYSGLCVCLYSGCIDLDQADDGAFEIAMDRYGPDVLEMLQEGGSLLWDQVKSCGIRECLSEEAILSETDDCCDVCGQCENEV